MCLVSGVADIGIGGSRISKQSISKNYVNQCAYQTAKSDVVEWEQNNKGVDP